MMNRPQSQNRRARPDIVFLVSAAVLLLIGLVVLISASSAAGYAKFGDTYYFIKKQILFGLIPGLALFFICLKLNCRIIKKLAWPFYGFTLILLILVFIPGVGLTINGARSWINIFGYSFQPSELAKLALIIMLAVFGASRGDKLNNLQTGLLPVLGIIFPAIILIALQPDVGTLGIILVLIFALLYLAGLKKIYLFILTLLGIIALGVMLLLAPYRMQRLITFLHPELDPRGIGYQTNQALLAVGSGGWFGLGLGHSRQKFQYLPEVQADSIFAVLAEEMGFVFSVLFILLILFICLRGLKIAKFAPDQFGRLLASGIMIWFMWQSTINIGSMVGFLPLTGIPLPFVSHGGSALMVSLAAVGLAGSVSKNEKY